MRTTLAGFLGRLEGALTALHPPGQYVRFDLSERLRGDKLQRYQAYSLGMLGGWLSADDVRAEEQMPPVPGGIGKTFLAPINTEPLQKMLADSMAATQQQQDTQPPAGGNDAAQTGG